MDSEIRNVACVGTGLIGQGWATLFAARGYGVTMVDMSGEILQKAAQKVEANLGFLESHGLLPRGESSLAFQRVRCVPDLGEAVKEADYVQESVPDNYQAKREIFKEMDEASGPRTILASSSSGLLMTEIQKAVRRPGRCVLAHPFLPVYLLPLVEVVGGEQTAPEAVDATCSFMEKLGQTPVRLKKEVPGYIVNRLQAAVLREAMDLAAGGVASPEEIDRAFCSGMGLRDPFIGPFLRAHLAGGSFEDFLRNYEDSYRLRWESMATWKAVPPSMCPSLIEGVNEMGVVKKHSPDEIKEWRDRTLVEVLKVRRWCC